MCHQLLLNSTPTHFSVTFGLFVKITSVLFTCVRGTDQIRERTAFSDSYPGI